MSFRCDLMLRKLKENCTWLVLAIWHRNSIERWPKYRFFFCVCLSSTFQPSYFWNNLKSFYTPCSCQHFIIALRCTKRFTIYWMYEHEHLLFAHRKIPKNTMDWICFRLNLLLLISQINDISLLFSQYSSAIQFVSPKLNLQNSLPIEMGTFVANSTHHWMEMFTA